MGKTGEAVIGS